MYVCLLNRIASIIQPERLAYLPAGTPSLLRSAAVILPQDFADEAVRDVEHASLGTILREARNAAGLSAEQAADVTKIRLDYIKSEAKRS